jgi:hypothetical protein
MHWPPDYHSILIKRQQALFRVKGDLRMVHGAREYYRTRPVEFIEDWCVTYDPRNAMHETLPVLMPFKLFDKQKTLVHFILDLLKTQESGLIEKCRDVGATWLCSAVSVWLWLYVDGSSIGWGSRKANLVDKLGDPDSIFEKIRMVIEYLPRFLWPRNFSPKNHCLYMRIINPENGSTITGEAGDNIGRGGRKAIFFCDESAHYERPELIEAALSETTRVRVDLSSVNGHGNVFARRRQSGIVWQPGKDIPRGVTRVFIFDWRDHPAKDIEWYESRKEKFKREGMLHIFAQEIDRDYSAAVERVVIPAIWVKSAIDAHKKLGIDTDGRIISALDVAEEGGDLNCYTRRNGIVLKQCNTWGEPDVGITTKQAIHYMRLDGSRNLQYDSIGIGSSVKTTVNHLRREDGNEWINSISFVKWVASSSPLHKERRIIQGDKTTARNRDFYENLKAQGWWQLRVRFERTYRAVEHGEVYPDTDLISIDSTLTELHELTTELSQATYNINGKGKIVIDKTPSGTKSPNRADSVVMNYWPVLNKKVMI